MSDLYAARCGITRDELWYLAKLTEEVGELNSAYLSASGRGRARGLDAAALEQAVEDELADVMAMVLLFARSQDIDLAAALARKWGRYVAD
ncbi:MAG: MazG nucleotide pyrophosphohydrolase domain-containing protein [Pseudomonadota bacterium]